MAGIKVLGRPAEFGGDGVVVFGRFFVEVLAGQEHGDDGVLGVGGVVAWNHVAVVISNGLVKKIKLVKKGIIHK